MKTEFRKRREARERVARALRETKKRLELDSSISSEGTRLQLPHGNESQRQHRPLTEFQVQHPQPISYMITSGSAGRRRVRQVRRKASMIAPAYNKGAAVSSR